jgi:iron complex outermembrane receptor protein
MRKSLLLALNMVLISQLTQSATAESEDAFEFFQEEAKVVTASRREQPISEAPVAIDVITAEEIKASGAVNLPDLLRFRTGMDVIDGHPTNSANRAVVSVRGFAETFARNVLVLVDGRKVLSADDGGVFWDELPVQMQDIERIEIIRGPNAALYGSGAGLGVINIITRKPSNNTTVALDERGGNRGTVQSYESVNSSIKSFSYNLSHTYLQQGGFDKADGSGVANDYFHGHKANFRSDWHPADASDVELFAGGSWSANGLEDVFDSRDGFDQHFEMLKVSQTLNESSHIQFLSSRNDYASNVASAENITEHLRNYQYNDEILHQLDWLNGRMKSTYGFDYQYAKSDSAQNYPGDPGKENLYRTYINQTAQLTPHVIWVGAFSWDARDNGKPEPNYQLSHLWEPIQDHSFRLSYSVAHTIPTLRLLNSNNTVATPNVFGDPNLLPETLRSYETGYRGNWLNHHLQTDADLFYTVVHDKDESNIDFSQPTPVLTFANQNTAIARGAELSLKYRFDAKRSTYVNFTHEHITDSFGNTGEVTNNTPAYAVNFGGIADLGYGFTGSVNVGYKDSYFIDFQANSATPSAYWRMDARLAYTLPWYKDAELYVAGQNLLESDHSEYADSLTVPRTYQGGVTVKFGGKD